jgi:hypothetical protein
MPIPLIPVIITAAASAVVAGAIIYFFVSNDANKKRVEYMTKVNGVLGLIQQKIQKLKEKIAEKDNTIEMLKQEELENRKEIEKLKRDVETYKEKLQQAEKEKEVYKKEICSWKNMHEIALDGLGISAVISAAGMLKGSPIFQGVNYKPKKAFEYLDRKIIDLNKEVLSIS